MIREDLEKEIEILKTGVKDTSKPQLGASYVQETESAVIVESQPELSAGNYRTFSPQKLK